jgi:uncharacterized protein (TIGR03067 family)
LLLVLAAGFLVAADAPQDPGANDLPKLQGAWTLVALEVNGEKQPPEKIKRTLVYAGHNWRVKIGDDELEGSSKLDASKLPRAIDITENTGPNKGETSLGIYEIDGDTYRACVAPPGKDRPKEFISKPGTDLQLLEFKRVKPAIVVRDPKEAHKLFIQAVNRRDLESLCAMYEPGARLVDEPGQPAVGSIAIRKQFEKLLAFKGKMEGFTTVCSQAGDLVLLKADWSFTGTGPDGKPVNLTGKSIEVMRRQPDGTWRFVIDLPYGHE